MASSLSAFTSSEFTVRFKEPYLTDGLNAKAAVAIPPGVYRGFRLATSGSALSVTVTADAVGSDHVAIFQTSGGRSLTIRRTGGNFTLDLSAYASKTAVIAIFGTYALGSTTTAEIRAYELSPVDEFSGASEKPQLIVLGTVVVPAAGTISAASITHDRRTFAWTTQSTEATRWTPVVQNGGFELAAADNASGMFSIYGWENPGGASGGNWRSGASGTGATGQRSLELNVTASPVSATLQQVVRIPTIDQSGRAVYVRFSCRVRSLIAPTVSALVNAAISWADATGAIVATTSIPLVVVGATDASFRVIDRTVLAQGAFYAGVSVKAVAQTYGSTGVALRVDDIQVFIEPRATEERRSDTEGLLPLLAAHRVFIGDPTAAFGSATPGAVLAFDPSSPTNVGRVRLTNPADSAAPTALPALFLDRIMGLGGNLTDATGALVARMGGSFPAETFTLLQEWTGPASTGFIRVYAGSGGKYYVTLNAKRGATQWTRDYTSQRSSRLQLDSVSGAVLSVEQCETTTASPFNDGDWRAFAVMTGATPTTIANPAFAPLLGMRDAAGNRRTIVDHNGFRMGRVTSIRQEWLIGGTGSMPEGWTAAVTATGTVSRVLDSNLATYAIELGVDADADEAFLRTTNNTIPFVVGGSGDNKSVVMEWEASTSFSGASPGPEGVMGFRPTGALNSGWFFAKTQGTANWLIARGNNGGFGAPIDTGVATVTNTAQRFRLEMHGTGAPGGARCLAWINGALVGETTANVPDRVTAPYFYLVRITGGPALAAMRIGPVLCDFNRVLSEDAL